MYILATDVLNGDKTCSKDQLESHFIKIFVPTVHVQAPHLLQYDLQIAKISQFINNMSKRISSYLMTHSYSSPKELVNLQKELLKLNTKQNSLRHLPFLFNIY